MANKKTKLRSHKSWKLPPPNQRVEFGAIPRKEFRKVLKNHKTRKMGNSTYGECNIIIKYKEKVSGYNKITDYPPNIEPHQMRFAEYYGYLPVGLNGKKTKDKLTISHRCGIHECITRKHLYLQKNSDNNKRRKCHKRLIKKRYSLISKGQYNKYYLTDDQCDCKPHCFISCKESK